MNIKYNKFNNYLKRINFGDARNVQVDCSVENLVQLNTRAMEHKIKKRRERRKGNNLQGNVVTHRRLGTDLPWQQET